MFNAQVAKGQQIIIQRLKKLKCGSPVFMKCCDNTNNCILGDVISINSYSQENCMNSSFTAANRELFSPSLLYVKRSACDLVGICSEKKIIKSFLLTTSPPPFGNVLLTVNNFFLVSLINSSKNFKWGKFCLYVREMKRAFLGECVFFHKIWWHGDWETVPRAGALCQLQPKLQNYWIGLVVPRLHVPCHPPAF